jgi:hypothetical protein
VANISGYSADAAALEDVVEAAGVLVLVALLPVLSGVAVSLEAVLLFEDVVSLALLEEPEDFSSLCFERLSLIYHPEPLNTIPAG